jgi:hypothetical protein
MKPKPLSSLNHLTVPVAMIYSSMAHVLCERGGSFWQRLRALNTVAPSASRST